MRSIVSDESVCSDFLPTSNAFSYCFSFIRCSIFIRSWKSLSLLPMKSRAMVITSSWLMLSQE